VVNAGIVYYQRRACFKSGKKIVPQELLEVNALHRAQLAGGGYHALLIESTQYGKVLAPLEGHRLDQAFLAYCPAKQAVQSQ